MRRTFLLAACAAALAIVGACAESDETAETVVPADGGTTTIPDPPLADGSTDAAADASALDGGRPPSPSPCNAIGWCATALPEPRLELRDVWPFEARAFAVAESDVLGTKVLEWTEASNTWSYIDDDSQNAYGSGHYAGKVWAPNENEVYFTTAPALVFHGVRANPSTPFSWESTRLPYDVSDGGSGDDPAYAWQIRDTYAAYYGLPHFKQHIGAIGVWGTSADDVYAWYANRIYHRTRADGGAVRWVEEHAAETSSPGESFYVFGAAGSSPDDVWFVGSHGAHDPQSGFAGCSSLIRRTTDGYARVMDSCGDEGGRLVIQAEIEFPGYGTITLHWNEPGWATSVDSSRPGTAAVVVNNKGFVYVDIADAGTARFNSVVGADPPVTGEKPNLQSVWLRGEHAWFSGWGLVLDGEYKTSAWLQSYGLRTPAEMPNLVGIDGQPIDGGATLSISSTALNGTPLDAPLYQVRGTSNDNLWAVGSGYALHKKTP